MRHSLEGFLRRYLLAVQATTRVPVRGALAGLQGAKPDMQHASTPHFPGVGWLVGMAACVAFAVVSLALPDVPFTPLAAAVACMIATAALTGASHERSVTHLTGDTLAITLLLFAKAALLAVMAAHSPGAVLTALLAAHTVSRFWPLVLMHTVPAVPGLVDIGSPPIEPITRRALGTGAAWCVVPLALMGLAHGAAFMLVPLAASGAAIWALRHWLRRTGGLSSTGLSASQQVAEVAFYLGAGFGL